MSVPNIAEADRAEVVSMMPPLAQQLVASLGFDDAFVVLDRLGGQRVRPPKDTAVDSELAQELGQPLAERLASFLNGSTRDLPRLFSVERWLRDRAIRAEVAAGSSVRDIALRHSIVERTVRIILKRPPVPLQQVPHA